MYYKGKEIENTKPSPFTVICNNCGSHNVSITAFEYYDLGITCHNCRAHLDCGRYNETNYEEGE